MKTNVSERVRQLRDIGDNVFQINAALRCTSNIHSFKNSDINRINL